MDDFAKTNAILEVNRAKEIQQLRQDLEKIFENFVHWLEADHGLYWITGKPGSGKSTLMKFISAHPNTRKHLQTWARGRKLVTASFYFWSPAKNQLQKSQAGLLRSTLLDGTPSTDEPMFCFFIDGLDEYDGNPQDIIELVGILRHSPYIKVCVASRPWNEFETAFGLNRAWVLCVHDLTRDDIRLYTTETLGKDLIFQQLRKMDDRCPDLVEDVVKTAEGVFFVDERYQEQMSTTFIVTLRARKLLPVFTYWHIDEDIADDYVFDLETKAPPPAFGQESDAELLDTICYHMDGLDSLDDASRTQMRLAAHMRSTLIARGGYDSSGNKLSRFSPHQFRTTRERISPQSTARVKIRERTDIRAWHQCCGTLRVIAAKHPLNGFIDEYASDFQSATANSKWNDAALTAHFRAGLRDEIKDLLISKDRSEKPSIFSWKSVETPNSCYDGSIEDYISGFKTLAQGFEGHELPYVLRISWTGGQDGIDSRTGRYGQKIPRSAHIGSFNKHTDAGMQKMREKQAETS
ncbi:hypothetical protein V492_02587 [Pseudogymnoascus sp. VKM F-4246]|nr:hypothetical protein V492_02587 [Pseudogymnoascus sp. VKM F-4246]